MDDRAEVESLSWIAQTIGALSKLKTMERKEHCPQPPNQSDAFLGHFNLPETWTLALLQ